MQETPKCHSKVTRKNTVERTIDRHDFFDPFYFLPNFFTCMHIVGEQKNEKMKKMMKYQPLSRKEALHLNVCSEWLVEYIFR